MTCALVRIFLSPLDLITGCMRLPNLGIAVRCLGDPKTFVNPVRRAQESGFHSVWLVEVNDVDALAFALALCQVTDKIRICTGVVNSNLRLPTLLAKLNFGATKFFL